MSALRYLLLGFGALLLLSACRGVSDVGPDQWTAAIEQRLAVDEVDEDVIACVLRIGEADLKRGPLGEVAIAELLAGCGQARAVIDAPTGDDGPDIELALTDLPWTFGDDPDLDRLWTACDEGSGAACEELFEASAPGSEYEEFGVSCGDRPDALHCLDLDAEDPDDGANGQP